jgi:hypothetical protein
MLDPDSKPGAAMRKAFPGGRAPALPDLFSIGQFVRCTIIKLGGEGDDDEAGGRRGKVSLSLRLRRLCEGQGAEALAVGRCVPAVVKSVEDHVYTLGFGIKVRAVVVLCGLVSLSNRLLLPLPCECLHHPHPDNNASNS